MPAIEPVCSRFAPLQPDQNDVVFRVEVAQDRHDFDVEPLDLRPLEDRQAIPLHPVADLADAHVPSGVEERRGAVAGVSA